LGQKGGPGDNAPALRPAGKVTKIDGEGVSKCLAFNTEQRPGTPDEIAKYRRSAMQQPGVSVLHYGSADDVIPHPEGEAFGMRTMTGLGEGVQDVIKNYPSSELMQWRLERQEDVYKSSKAEPLGRTALRGHQLPEHLNHAPFGDFIDAKDKSYNPRSKEVIYPPDVDTTSDDPALHQMYLKSHMAFQAGEQRRRNYDWDAANIDPGTHKFGAVEKDVYREGVAKALNPAIDENFRDKVNIVPKRLEHFKITDQDELGRPRNLGHGKQLPADHTFGRPARLFEEWGTRKLIVGDYCEEEQQPDADLGKSIKPGFRNVAPVDDKVFGVPSVRTDISNRIAHQATHQVAEGMTVKFSKAFNDNTNYGEEPDAGVLMYPGPAADKGVTESQYITPYEKAKLKSFLEGAGVETENFDEYFKYAADMDQFPGGDKACIISYQKVKRHFEAQKLIS